MTPVGKDFSREMIIKTLTCPKKINDDSNKSSFSFENEIKAEINLNKSISKNEN